MTRRARLGTCTALVLALGIAGPATSQTGVTAAIRVFQFQPGVLEVRAGSRVTWRNEDDILHTVTSGAPGNPDGRFDLQLAGKGAQGGALFADRGAYLYHCARHPAMQGEVVVR
jgi:plastocyanin